MKQNNVHKNWKKNPHKHGRYACVKKLTDTHYNKGNWYQNETELISNAVINQNMSLFATELNQAFYVEGDYWKKPELYMKELFTLREWHLF